MMSIALPERCYCADVKYPMAVVSTAGRGIIVYELSGQPKEYKKIESPLKYQHRAVAIFSDKTKNEPVGFALGSVEGRVAVQYVNPVNPKDNFTFKCHRSTEVVNGYQDIYSVRGLPLNLTYLRQLGVVLFTVDMNVLVRLNLIRAPFVLL
jgi:mRNA export factor